MALYRTNVALAIKGDRIEKDTEIELTAEDVAAFDPKDIELVSDAPSPAPADEAPVSLEDMTSAELKARAKELGLSAGGSAADLRERIALHLEGGSTDGEEPKADESEATDGEEPKAD